MKTNISQQKKYSTGKGSYQLFLPLDYEVVIPENDSVRLLSQIMEELDYTELYKAYSREGRKPATEPKILAKVMVYAYMELIVKVYHTEFTVSKETVNDDMEKMAAFLEQKKVEERIEFVHGSGKRKSNLQKLLEALYSYLGRQQGYDESKEILGERNSYSKTDKDATFMRMKDDHMRNGQLKPAYNIQLAMEAEYVIGTGIFSNPGDTTTLKPILENMYKLNTNMTIKRLIADSGYESEENYMYLESRGMDCYIKPQTYEQQKKRSFKKNISKRENMAYDAEADEYVCHNGQRLKPIGTFNKKSSTGYVSEVTVYECESCEGCPHKDKCTKAKGNRRMQVSKTFIEKRQKSYENIITEKGVLLRVNRSIQAEGAFGVLKKDRQFDRFLTRGSPNVSTELLLLCFGYNVNKLHAKIQNERCGKPLHELKAAIFFRHISAYSANTIPMLTRFIIYGIIGWCMEILWTGASSLSRRDYTLGANTSIWMFFIYGAAVFLEPVCDILADYHIILRGCVYMLIIFAAEYLSGVALKRARICPWDYSGNAYSVHGVIRLDYAPAWFAAGLIFETVYRFLS